MKKIQCVLSVTLTLCVIFNLLSTIALAAASDAGENSWDISEAQETGQVLARFEGNTLYITGSGRMTSSFRNGVPWADFKQSISNVVVDSGVTNVGAYAFNYCKNLSSVSLPDSLTEIGTYAFHATGIKRLTIPVGVNVIGRMIATPNTYFEVLGNPTNVNDYAFSTSLVSVKDQASAETLNSKTNVSAIIVLDGGKYGDTDAALANLSYGLISPIKEGCTFQGWYRDAAFTDPCSISADGRYIVNVNKVYYAKWSAQLPDTPSTPDTPNVPSIPDTPSTPGIPGTPSVPSSDSSSVAATPPAVTTAATSQRGTLTTETTAKPAAVITGGTASAAVDPAMGDEIVKQAVANNSENIVIAPEIKGNVSKTEVVIPTGTVEQIGVNTNANLIVSTSVAELAISNGALNSMAGSGERVIITAERNGSTLEVAVKVDDTVMEKVPGGLTVTVPVEKAAPGVVAVLVLEEGTQQIIRKSVTTKDRIIIPLDGSAKVKIVDNSKQFSDVSADSWEAAAVSFASAHELFNGTSAATFSPNLPMSRGMMAVVLHNLEKNPKQGITGVFADVDDSAWYAEGVAWAAENGIISGYSDGRFGPGDNIAREQLAVMLWRYAGKPATAGGDLLFHDADKVSDWAMEAMCWATEKGIINGKGNGILDPAGKATRAQVAQMLKNFMETQLS